jgi:hypothetical protein
MNARANILLAAEARGHLLLGFGAVLALTVLSTLLYAGAAWAAPFTVTNTNDSGPGSLREAIEQANANAGADEIAFADGVSGTITLSSSLPTITDEAGLVIDGGGDVTVSGLSRAGSDVGPGAVLWLRNLTTIGLGIKNSGTLEVTNSTISGNFEEFGGGIYNSGTLKVTNSTISRNTAEIAGAGIYNSDSGTLEVTNSTIWRNSTFSDGTGGGIYNRGTLEVTNSTIATNYGGDFGSGWGINNSSTGTATLTNTIMDQILSQRNCSGTLTNGGFTDGGFNIDSGTSCGFAQAKGSLSNTNPLLEPAPEGGTLLADNGGPTQTIALQLDSPAVDLVSADTCPPPATDQRGVQRPQGEACDSGAFELEELPDTTAPTVISTVPKANAVEVAPTANVRATFSEEMQEASVKNAFKLYKKGSTTQIAAVVSYDAATDKATLNPNNNLRRGAAYKAVVTTVAKDVAGNRLDQDSSTTGLQQKVWYFTVDD